MRELTSVSLPGSRRTSTVRSIVLVVLAGLLALSCISCRLIKPPDPTPTPDYPALETEVAYKLSVRHTALAPTLAATMTPTSPAPTHTPTETATSRPSPSPTTTTRPTALPQAPLLAYVRAPHDGPANIVMSDPERPRGQVLTHFVEPMSMSDLSWSPDGQWLLFVSAHGLIHSHGNERNVFVVRPDGTDLRMLTGNYMDPELAPGPYKVLRGEVAGAEGTCLVGAQGATGPVLADEGGAFEVPGVPLSAKWARAVCQDGDRVYQGDAELESANGDFEFLTIPVEARGQGWRQVSISRDGQILVGTFYQWTLDEEGGRQYVLGGVLFDVDGNYLMTLALPPETTIRGLAWSPVADQIVGAVTGEHSTSLWLWDGQGESIGPLVEITNPQTTILSAGSPVWSPDGSQIAFDLRHWLWWGESKRKTELMVAPAHGGEAHVLVPTEWGAHATSPSWAEGGVTLFYQLSLTDPEGDFGSEDQSDIWSVQAEDPTPTAWTSNGASYLPAAR